MHPQPFLLAALILVWLALDGLALLYLTRERQLTPQEMRLWTFLALFLPIVGPICVIAGKPGQPRSLRKG